jgi:hypothetical protein
MPASERCDHERDQRDRDRVGEKPTSDTLEEDQGQRRVRSVAITCVRAPAANAAANRLGQPRQPVAALGRSARASPADDAINGRPTAMNESQKPGCVSPRDRRVTTNAAARRTSAHGQRSPPCGSVTVAESIRPASLHAPASEERCGGGEVPRRARSARQPAHRPRAASPGRADRQAGEPREHRHVQAADRHQVGDAGVAEQVPVVALDRALVADRERRQHAGGAAVADVGVDPVANALAQPLDRMTSARVEQRRRRVAHVAGGANALLEQRQLEVEAVRVEVAVRLAQAHREAPALAGAQRQRGCTRARPRGSPRTTERDDARHARRRAARVDFEAKRSPLGPCAAELATTPVTTTSRPSSSAGRVSARRSDAWLPASANPAASTATTSSANARRERTLASATTTAAIVIAR